ncbi:MAG: hypothetical protein ACKOXH_04495 [Aquirufa sp.]
MIEQSPKRNKKISLKHEAESGGLAAQTENVLGELLTETFATLKRCAILHQSSRIVKHYFRFFIQIIN